MTMTSRPFGRTRRWMIFSRSARCPTAKLGTAARSVAAISRRAIMRQRSDATGMFGMKWERVCVHEAGTCAQRWQIAVGQCFLHPMLKMLEALSSRLDPARLRASEPIAPYTTFRIGGPADVMFEARSADELATAVLTARELGIPWFVLGLGANILVGDKGFRGLIIRNVAKHVRFHEDGRLWVESGAVVAELIKDAVHRGWSGLEHYVG